MILRDTEMETHIFKHIQREKGNYLLVHSPYDDNHDHRPQLEQGALHTIQVSQEGSRDALSQLITTASQGLNGQELAVRSQHQASIPCVIIIRDICTLISKLNGWQNGNFKWKQLISVCTKLNCSSVSHQNTS